MCIRKGGVSCFNLEGCEPSDVRICGEINNNISVVFTTVFVCLFVVLFTCLLDSLVSYLLYCIIINLD